MGYEIDSKRQFKLRFKNWNVIGAHYATFNKKAMFIAKTSSICTGYFIRKGQWQKILKSSPDIAKQLKFKILRDFNRQMRHPMMIQKQRDINALQKRTKYKKLFKEVETSNHEMFELLLSISDVHDIDKMKNRSSSYQDSEIQIMQVQIGIQLSIYEKILVKFVNKCEEMAYYLLSL